jgi:oligoendopeptidase F
MTLSRTWDLTPFFVDFNAPERTAFRDAVVADVKVLLDLAQSTPVLSEATADVWEDVWVRSEQLMTRLSHYYVFVSCLASCDAGNEVYQKEYSANAQLVAEADKCGVEMKRAIKDASEEVFRKFIQREALQPIQYSMLRVREAARKTMSAELESLTSDLGICGLSAWGRLYNQIAGKLSFEMEFPDGRKETVPMAKRRSLMEDVDRRVREAAFRKGNDAWAVFQDVTAAAINNIAGTRLLLNKRRGVDHFLDVALFQARISRKTLEAMFSAIETCRPLIVEIGKAKAKAVGLKKMAWFDIDAPLPLEDSKRFSWEEATALVEKAFSRCYPELADFFRTALAQRWVESEVRGGKRPGAYCTGSQYIDQSRVFMTFNGSLGDVQTLAHEIGHAFHSFAMKGLRPSARSYPMTLAETASTFAEMILSDGILEDPVISPAQKANVLNITLSHALAFLMDIPVRFEFEKNFHEERQQGEVSVSRLKELMTQAQRKTFGDLLAEGGEDPYFWASKLHFYITEVTFYNFPYTFGFLLSRGLNARFHKEGPAFLGKYQDFLRLSGSDTAEQVARRTIGCELESPDFWIESIKSLEPVLQRFNAILPEIGLPR